MAEELNLKRTRASGEVLEYLLKEFEVNQNPSPEQRKEISEKTSMSEKAVRIWFQNRRAKLRKFERMGKPIKSPSSATLNAHNQEQRSNASSRSSLLTNIHANTSALPELPILAENYCLVDCSSLSVGSWQRVKTGGNNPTLLKTIDTLAPFNVSKVMSDVDLLVIISRKNNEINYFFTATSNNSKILFRIFYPVKSVVSCSLMDNSISKEKNEIRVTLVQKPRFSLYFFNGLRAELNQWSVCDDFSEGKQVSSAFYSSGGENIPHVLVGPRLSLDKLNRFIMETTQNSHLHPRYRGVPPLIGSGLKSSIPETKTPSQNSDVSYGHPEPGMAPESNDYIDPAEVHGAKSNLQIKPELQNWGGSLSGDLSYDIKPEFENHEHKMAVQGAAGQSAGGYDRTAFEVLDDDTIQANQRKAEDSYNELSTESPDFFTTAQRPNSNLILSHGNQEELVYSPSTDVHSFAAADRGLEKGVGRKDNSSATRRRIFETSYSEEASVDHNYDESDAHPYGFNMNMSDSNNDSPSVSNTAAVRNMVASTSHLDNYINYNGHL